MKNRTISFLTILAILAFILATIMHKSRNVYVEDQKIERTFAIIKPDAVKAKNSGNIIDLIESNGFTIVAMKKLNLTQGQAQQFYDIHKDRPFFSQLVEFMTSGPVIIMILAKNNAVADWRALMGATDPSKAEPNTIRKLYGTNISQNATHGSDSIENAQKEIALAKNWL